jgi:hypothetical protein
MVSTFYLPSFAALIIPSVMRVSQYEESFGEQNGIISKLAKPEPIITPARNHNV